MKFLQKSVVIKLVLWFIILGALVGGVSVYFYMSGEQMVPVKVLLVGLVIFAILIVSSVLFSVVRPLRIIISQVQALLAGKPYKKIYTTRVDEIGVLAYFFNQVTTGLGEVSSDIEDRERMLDELTIASQLQQEILPEKSISLPGLQIVAKTKPATEVGGDSFDFVKVADKTYIYIGDVTGHGVPGGLIMTMVNAFVEVFADSMGSAREIIINVNKYIKRRIRKAMFMTMVMLCWDSKAQKMTYVGAGHEHILVYHADTGECEAILSGGVALGMLPDNSEVAVEKEILLKDGDFIVLYSDGITEARNSEGMQFGLENLKRSVIEYAPEYSAEGLNYHIARDVSHFMKGQTQLDDMTLIVIRKDKNILESSALEDSSITWKDE